MDVKEPKTRNYLYSVEAIKALDELAVQLKEKGQKKNKAQIVSDAIVHYAHSQGIEVEGQKKEASLQSIAKKTRKLEQLVEALCRVVLGSDCEQEEELIEAEEALTDALKAGCKRNSDTLWKETQEDLPECMQDKDLFMIYVGGYGLPAKPKPKGKRKKK
jgi:hypothetical protein